MEIWDQWSRCGDRVILLENVLVFVNRVRSHKMFIVPQKPGLIRNMLVVGLSQNVVSTGLDCLWTIDGNDNCSLWYLFWGHFPPGKHKTAYKKIELVNIRDVYSRFVASAFVGINFPLSSSAVCWPILFCFFFPPLVLFGQAKTSFLGIFLSLPPGWKSVGPSPGWRIEQMTSQPLVDCSGVLAKLFTCIERVILKPNFVCKLPLSRRGYWKGLAALGI